MSEASSHLIESHGFYGMSNASNATTNGQSSAAKPPEQFTRPEIQLAFRNHGSQLEGLQYSITPAGMQYLVVHYDIPKVDVSTYRLTISGLVSRMMTLSLDDIMQRPAARIPITMECAGNGRSLFTPRHPSIPWTYDAIGTSYWTGCQLGPLLKEAGISNDAIDVVFTGMDKGFEGGEVQHYQRSLSVAEATLNDVILAYKMNDEPLQPQHGYPLRLVVPGWYGVTNVKWLNKIEVIDHTFKGYQMKAYSIKSSLADPGVKVTLMKVKSLMVPPGIPDFLTRTRFVEAGLVRIQGRAWSGRKQIIKVEFSSDNGQNWAECNLETEIGTHAWVGWNYAWHAIVGTSVLCCRATDSDGNIQPWEAPFNVRGFANNSIQKLDVLVVNRISEKNRNDLQKLLALHVQPQTKL